MSKTRQVKQGEHLSGIAAEEGFADFRTIFDHGENAELKALRDPHVLFPGDKVFVPDREDRIESRTTDNSHVFVADIRPLFLRCKLLDWHRDPIKSAPCTLKIDAEDVPPTTTDANGIFLQRIARTAKTADIEAELPAAKVRIVEEEPRRATFHAKIGSLNPETKLSGQQARLNNLGYPAGYDLRDLDQLLWAAEEFLCDDTRQKVTKQPTIKPAPPQGEDDPQTSNPAGKTGIQDAELLARLKKAHGF